MIPRSEFHHMPADRLPHPGQEIEAVLERTEGPNGYVVLSYEKARRGKAWDLVEEAFASNASVKGRELEFRVVSLDKKRGNIVLSRKAILDEVALVKKKEASDALADGRVLKGLSLIHISEPTRLLSISYA